MAWFLFGVDGDHAGHDATWPATQVGPEAGRGVSEKPERPCIITTNGRKHFYPLRKLDRLARMGNVHLP